MRQFVESGSLRLAATALLAVLAAPLAAQGVQSLGTACGGSGGPPSLAVSQPLSLGASSTLLGRNLGAQMGAQSGGLLVHGWSGDTWGPVALPSSLAPFGMPGCWLHVRPEVVLPFYSAWSPAQWGVQVPNAAELLGTSLYSQVLFVQPGLNGAGFGSTPGLRLRIGPGATPTQSTTQVAQNGITFVFAQPVEAGQFVNGDWFVVGPVRIADMWPQVTTTTAGRVLHGAMVDPDASTANHGYDSQLYGSQFPAYYVPALNKALGVSIASPLALQPGQAVIKVESLPLPSGVPTLRRAAVLTVLAQAPPEGSFRPPYAGSAREVQYHAAMIDWSKLRSLQPEPGMPDVAQCIDTLQRVWLDHSPSWLGRMMHPKEHMPDYGRDLASVLGEAAMLCNSALPQAEKRQLAIRLVQIGIDCCGNLRDGCRWSGLGGHASGRKLPILFAGALLDDASMLAVGRDYVSERRPDGTQTRYFGEDSQTFVVEETSPGVVNFGAGGYTLADVGLPEWGFSHVEDPSNDVRAWDGNPYRVCCTVNGWLGHVLAARVMGLVDAWHHPVLFDYTDRYMAIVTTGWTRSWSPWVGAMWARYRPVF